jgi:hypothetical protein
MNERPTMWVNDRQLSDGYFVSHKNCQHLMNERTDEQTKLERRDYELVLINGKSVVDGAAGNWTYLVYDPEGCTQ